MLGSKNSYKILISILLFIFLISNGIYRSSINQRDLLIDTIGSIILITIYLVFFKKWKQDALSYSFLALSLSIHNMYLYGTLIFGIRFDHYMHFLGGFTIALVIDRILKDKLNTSNRIFIAIISALGIGSLGEVIEWLGYSLLGSGDGFLLYGLGDEGEWQNASLDMIFNFLGGILAGILIFILSKQKQLKTRRHK